MKIKKVLEKAREVLLMERMKENNQFSFQYIKLSDQLILIDNLIEIFERGEEDREGDGKTNLTFIDNPTPKKKAELKGKAQTKTPQEKRMMMKKGMPIHFYGCRYKVIRVRPNGRVVLQFKGFLKEEGEEK